jgi:hypothetical protein
MGLYATIVFWLNLGLETPKLWSIRNHDAWYISFVIACHLLRNCDLVVCNLLNAAFSDSDYIGLNERMISG